MLGRPLGCRGGAGQTAPRVASAAAGFSTPRAAYPVQRRTSRQLPGWSPAPQVAGGAGGGSDRGSRRPNAGGGGGGDGGSGGDGGKRQPEEEPKPSGSGAAAAGPLGAVLKGWEERVAYDPEFPVKMFIEQVIGVGFAVLGDMSSRPNWGLSELDFVFSTLMVGSILNFTIMFTLAPTAATVGSVAAGNVLQRAMSDVYLKKWGAPGGNMFEPGGYTAGQRLTNLAYKGGVFAAIGFFAGILGTGVTNGLIAMRMRADPSYKPANEQPNILYNAGTWALHMGLSCNGRYQALGGADYILVKLMPLTAFRVYQTGIRALNNVVGGISFVTLARILGVQKSAAVEEVKA